jgi:NitT/TauT family transport system substrate-binding protein
MPPLPRLRMNQGDRSEGRIYFAPHFVAQRLGFFEQAGVSVDFVWAESGDHLAKSGQIPAVLNREADLTIGGPMVTMRMRSEGTADLVCFSAAVQANPWYLATRPGRAPFNWAALAGCSVLDVSRITTATISIGWILCKKGLADRVRLIDGSGDESADFARVAAGEVDYGLHSLHGLAPRICDGSLALASSLAPETGGVPWSAYIARRDAFLAEKSTYAAFARGIRSSLSWIASATPASIATLVADDYPDYPLDALNFGIERYKSEHIWPADTTIPRDDFMRFQTMLRDSGWFSTAVAYEDQVIADLADWSSDQQAL